MNIVLFNNSYIPAIKYGGTQRVVYYLAVELDKLGHDVTLLVKGSTKKTHLKIMIYDENKTLQEQLPIKTDIVHLHSRIDEVLTTPYVITMHGNTKKKDSLDINTIFVSSNHASRYGSDSYVLNGLDWDDYSSVDLNKKRDYYHFLGNAAWKVKNVVGAIDIVKKADEEIKVLGGDRFNFKMGIRFTFTPKASFYGMVGGEEKDRLLNGSRGLVFPVLWDEPFGLAITESLYFGAPVFATPYGSLQELVIPEVGFLSKSKEELVNAIEENHYKPHICHEYANDLFNSRVMAQEYLKKYEMVINGNKLNENNPILQEIPDKQNFKLKG